MDKSINGANSLTHSPRDNGSSAQGRPSPTSRATGAPAGGRIAPIATELIRVAYEDAWLRVECNRVLNAITGEESVAVRIVPSDSARHAVIIVPFLDDGRLVLLGRYRYAVGRWSIELPRFWGQTSDAGWRDAVEKHLLEVAGLKAEALKLLGAVDLDPSIISVNTIVILAEGCAGTLAKAADAADSIAGCIALAPCDVDDLVRRGEITCGATLAALFLYRTHSLGCFDRPQS